MRNNQFPLSAYQSMPQRRGRKKLLSRYGGIVRNIAMLIMVAAIGMLFIQVRSLQFKIDELSKAQKLSAGNFTQRSATGREYQDKNIAQRITYNNQSFDTYVVDISNTQVKFFFKDSEGNKFGSLENLKEFVASNSNELIFGTNAGMFTPSSEPLGLFVEQGQELFPLNLKDGKDNFFLKPNGVFAITDKRAYVVESPAYPNLAKSVLISGATQSGPMLVIGGRIHPKFNKNSANRNIRSGVGIISPTKIVFAISNDLVNFYDFAMLFKEQFKCQDALFLDGAISKMYLPVLERNELDGNFAGMIGITKKAQIRE
jgi:uncharacterized protein YigE (DUF2233 family)